MSKPSNSKQSATSTLNGASQIAGLTVGKSIWGLPYRSVGKTTLIGRFESIDMQNEVDKNSSDWLPKAPGGPR
jgi:hypothetical protein